MEASVEGTVGGHWGLFDSEARALRYPADVAVRNFPFWKAQLCCGQVFCLLIFTVDPAPCRKGCPLSRQIPWLATALIASVGGTLLGMTIESLLLHRRRQCSRTTYLNYHVF